MMEIKFRAWDKENKIWLVKTLEELLEWSADGCYQDRDMEFVEWQQFTGLKDKNGKEIYEGDLLKYWIENCEQINLYEVEDLRELFFEMNRDDNYYCFNEVEITGNIFENSELLK